MIRNVGAFTFGIATWICGTIFIATLRVASAQEPPKNFVFVDNTPVAEVSFNDAEGLARKLADFNGTMTRRMSAVAV